MKILKKIFSKNKVNLDDIDEKSIIEVATNYIFSLGGKENIEELYSCSTRLRVKLKENKIDVKKLGEIGSKKVIRLDDLNLQIVIGKNAAKLEETMKKYLGD